jgi:hypothetical protein
VISFHLELRVCLHHCWIAMSALRVQVPLADWVGSFLTVVFCSSHSGISLLTSLLRPHLFNGTQRKSLVLPGVRHPGAVFAAGRSQCLAPVPVRAWVSIGFGSGADHDSAQSIDRSQPLIP